MAGYNVKFSYVAPMWGDITLTALNEDEAQELAMDSIELSYPEAEDINIINIKELAD